LRLKENAEPATRPPAPKNREVTTLVLSHPDGASEADRTLLKELRDRCAELDTACLLITRFAEMLTTRSGQDKLEQWISDAENGPLPELRGFTTGLRKDFAAVLAGLSLPWSSGPVEGHVNRIKMLKRQMFGRAKPDLLRKRILLAT
jgi:transposase